MKKLGRYALIAVLVWWVVQDPTAAAHLTHMAGQWLTQAAHSLSALTGGGKG